jgi:3-dehydroquinate dehydratase/shikimate dehydrogenase
MMIAEHQNIAAHGVEIVELRLDYIRRPVDIKRLLAERPCPVVMTCRRPEDGGRWMKSEADRRAVLRTAIAEGADYVDLEMDIAGSIPRYGNTQRIVSYHNFEETPANLEEIHHQMTRMDPDVIKITTMANNPIDNIRTLRLCRNSRVPTIAFCMGDLGMPSRILCLRAGSPMTFATFTDERAMAPGQMSYRQMMQDYDCDRINQKTEILGVIADPVAHSFSPRVHNACIRDKKLNMLYLPFRVPKEYLRDFMQICPELGIRGLSVTIPHKEKILKSINVLDDQSAGIRAANTVVFKDINTFGYNTDCSAAIESLQAALAETPATDEAPATLAGKSTLILGAGGVARAIAYGLMKQKSKVTITARELRKSEALAGDLGCETLEWVTRGKANPDILINCTPVGMHPHMDDSPFELEWMRKHTIVFDTVYNPEQTLFIKKAREAGCPTVTGIDMFVRQAAKQFKLFTGVDPSMETIRYEVKRAISAARY